MNHPWILKYQKDDIVPKGDSMRNMIFIESLKTLSANYILWKHIVSYVATSMILTQVQTTLKKAFSKIDKKAKEFSVKQIREVFIKETSQGGVVEC